MSLHASTSQSTALIDLLAFITLHAYWFSLTPIIENQYRHFLILNIGVVTITFLRYLKKVNIKFLLKDEFNNLMYCSSKGR